MNDEMQIAKELTLAITDKLIVPNVRLANGSPTDRQEYNRELALEITRVYTEIYQSVLKVKEISDTKTTV
ncbi:hypothetical protein P4283_22740 [Bacillus thuringiensis]|nr:hypothetical protein [Bacillus thuringiensis]